MTATRPTIPKGTRDFGPAKMSKRQYIFDGIKNAFTRFGFEPLETPSMENLSVLTGKYGDEGDRLLFRVLNSGDFLKEVNTNSIKNYKKLSPKISTKGLRYDLTVPLARFVVMNRNEIVFPFRRYQMQPVWRADRPQKGRYREFYQCDVDIVGSDSILCDFEMAQVVGEVLNNLGIKNFRVKINHRQILKGFLESINCAEKEQEFAVTVDKMDKVGIEKVLQELELKGFQEKDREAIHNFLKLEGSNSDKINTLKSTLGKTPSGEKGCVEIEELFSMINSTSKNPECFIFDQSLARGLSYYTGCIFEAQSTAVDIGSIAGGGRYDNLTTMFGMPDVPATGISFGVDRIYDVMEQSDLFPVDLLVASKVLIAHFDKDCRNYGLEILNSLREAGVSCEIYPDISKLKKQLNYANNKGIPYVVVIGSEEL